MKSVPFYLLVIFSCLNLSCYSFKGISIPSNINTFYIGDFTNRALEAPADIDVRFAEAMRQKIRDESKLRYNEEEPDIQFEGDITTYKLSSEAPVQGNTVALGRLDIIINIRYTNNLDEKQNWKKTYSFFKTFDGNADVYSIQDGLIKDIFDNITEKIFNDSFTNW